MRHFKKISLITDSRAPLCQLESRIPWNQVLSALTPFFSESRKAPKQGIRLLAAFLILGKLYQLTDEEVLAQWLCDAYFQYFTGKRDFRWNLPLEAADLALFRQRLGQEGCNKLFEFLPKDPLGGAHRQIPKHLARTVCGSALPVKKVGAVLGASRALLITQYIKKAKRAAPLTPVEIYRELTRSSSWCKRVHCKIQQGQRPVVSCLLRISSWTSLKGPGVIHALNIAHTILQESASTEAPKASPFAVFVSKQR